MCEQENTQATTEQQNIEQRKHVHISITSQDCDGGHGHVYTMPGSMETNFRLHSLPLTENGEGTFTRKVYYNDGSDEMLYRMSWYARTDEGFHSEEWVECIDDDADEKSSQYDQFAEMMGY